MSIPENPCPICGGTSHEWGSAEIEYEDSIGEYARTQTKRAVLYFGTPTTALVIERKGFGKAKARRKAAFFKTPIQTRRCQTCGFLALFANPPVEDDAVDDTEESRP